MQSNARMLGTGADEGTAKINTQLILRIDKQMKPINLLSH